ncbi:hypothetical protein ABZT23_40665 [Streptomyces sp. NPDC005386]|uniref:hypothetical protein n=1 Tax=Streptomyces sp. NPDC005386 TaxID=3154562 RepID=UPI0033A78B62
MSARNPFPVRRPYPVTATGLIDFLVDGVYPLQEAHLRQYVAVEYAKRLAAGGYCGLVTPRGRCAFHPQRWCSPSSSSPATTRCI